MKVILQLHAEIDIPLYRLSYVCPDPNCQGEWHQVWCNEVEDACPACGQRDVSPADVKELPSDAEVPEDLDAVEAARDRLDSFRDAGVSAEWGIALYQPDPSPAEVIADGIHAVRGVVKCYQERGGTGAFRLAGAIIGLDGWARRAGETMAALATASA